MAQMQTLGKTATTVATDDDGRTVVTYHATAVVKFDREIIRLNTGGWDTVTTRARARWQQYHYHPGDAPPSGDRPSKWQR